MRMLKSSAVEIGRLLRANTVGFVAGCRVSQWSSPTFGALVRVPLGIAYEIFGLIYDIRIDDDGLVRQLATTEMVDEAVILDNRENRNVPVELGVISVGYRLEGRISHLLPPRPPLSLDVLYMCDEADLCAFSSAGRFGYFRHILRALDLPSNELLAAHLQQAGAAHDKAGNPDWMETATRELIILLRDDYAALMSILGSLRDIEV
jgi:hypothetical protein